MQCAKCGTVNHHYAKFCEECGVQLAFSCFRCGVLIRPTQKFCSNCGISLRAEESGNQGIGESGNKTIEDQEPQLQLLAPSQPRTQNPEPRLVDADPLLYTPPHLVNRILAGKAALEGERKIITILFADIKGSMDIMEGLDPEESKQLFDPCLHHMIEAVHRAEGTVSRVLGDGILALFGAPLAIEDHPHRALYAALLMHETVGRYAAELYQRHAITLQIRVGINTGEVVVGTIGTNLFMEYTPVGHAVGLAARMEALASPGSTLVTASTFHLTQEYFRFTPRGAIHIKGVKEPLDVYELAGSKGRQSRLAARSAHGLTPFLGRTQELAYMQELATQAISGHGQIISVIGEAGMGKSRLLEELKPTLRAQGFLLIEGAGFAYGKTRAYLPLIDMLKCYCSINDQDSPAVYREKLHETLAAVHPSLTSYVPLFLDLLEVGSTIPEVASLSAEAKLQKVLAGIKSLIALQSHRQPLALVVEDLHWLDARSLAFLQALTAGLAQIPVLLLLSYRPGESYPWETFPFSHRLQLAPLSRPELTSLFTTLGGADPAVAALAPEVCERSGGNPFFLEELVQSLRETGVLGGQVGAHKLAQPLAATTLPATVQGVLASRLDRLAPGHKSLLQTAAVIGRAVPRSLLLYVTGTPEEELDQVLHLLQTREFLYEAAIYPERVYSFKHALTQEVAYQELLHERRSYLHAAVGNAIETLYAEKLPEYVTLLAYHYSRSSETRKALHYLSLAGLRAFNLYADTDARYFWEEHLRLLHTLPASQERDQQEVRTRLYLMNVLSRQSSDDGLTQGQFAAAEAVCQRLQDPRLLVELHATLAVAYVLWGRPRPGLPHARSAKDIAESLQDVHLQVITFGPLAHLLWIAGDFREGLTIAEAGLSLIQQHNLVQEQLDFVAYPYVQCLAIAGACRGFLGDFDEGINTLQRAVLSAQPHGNRIPQALSHWGLALLHALRGDLERAQPEAEQASDIMVEVSPLSGSLLVGSLQEYLATLTAAFRFSPPSPTTTPRLLQTWQERAAFGELAGTWLAEIRLLAGDKQEARRFATDALVRAEESKSTWFLCAAHLTLGRVLGQEEGGEAARVTYHLRTAIDLARAMESLPLAAWSMLELGEFRCRKHSEGKKRENRGKRQESSSGLGDEREQTRELLRRTEELCNSLGMQAGLKRARTLLAHLAQG